MQFRNVDKIRSVVKAQISSNYLKEGNMSSEKICKTVHQYNQVPISEEDMRKLQEIADDYNKVKNYVYQRYGGIASLSKIYPGYTVQNEMTASGLREVLEIPSVYFYLAIFDALSDIKSQWTRVKSKISKTINTNSSLTSEEKHYLRFLLKVNNAFEMVLNQKPIELPEPMRRKYDEIAAQIDQDRMKRYLCRQVRKKLVKQYARKAEGFSIAERAYRYADHGIYISVKEKRKRIFIPLTDNNQYKAQLYIKLYPKEHNVEIKVPVYVAVRKHENYVNQVGVAVGIYTMLTTDLGQRYGEELGRYQKEYAEWIRIQTGCYNNNRKNNPGRKKYLSRKRRLEEQMHSYINHELNYFLQTEKPQIIYIAKLPKSHSKGKNRKINHLMSQWQRGYIRNRLVQKCREQSVGIKEVFGKDISNECSNCGAIGNKAAGIFFCGKCGFQIEEKTNTAKNIKNRGLGDGILY